MALIWAEHQELDKEVADIIEVGLNKLDNYRSRTEQVPAYILAMGMFIPNYYITC